MFKQGNSNRSGFWKNILLFIALGIAVLLISPVSASPAGDLGGKPVVTIVAGGDRSYYLGEEVFFSGVNSDSDSTYLFMTGPNLPEGGGKLTSPSQKTVSGDAGSFTVIKTKPDRTWKSSWYTSGLRLDAGTYTIYAVSQPKAQAQLAEVPYGTTGIIIKKPFISAEISPSSVKKWQPFTINGTAEGIPTAVQIWIFGDNYVSTTKIPVNPDASFTFNGDATMSGRLVKGQNYLFVQHPMADNQFDIDISGDYIRSLTLNNGTNIFRITGPGSLQGNDAAEALIAAFSDNEAPHDYTVDTYTVIPFNVDDAGSLTATTTPVQHQTQHAPIQYAPFGAIVLFLGIVLWNRH